MEKFSPKLVDQLIQYMHIKHGVVLTEAESNEYLRVYADAFLAFTKKGGEDGGASPSARAASAPLT